jgi:hypothetical protein
MKSLVKFLAVLAVVAMIAPQAAEAHGRNNHRWTNNNFQQGYCNTGYYNPVYYNPNPYPYGVQAPNGSWVDGYVGADGNAAWMGGVNKR